jgi:hypothetical protein
MLYCDVLGVTLQEFADPNGEHKPWNRLSGVRFLKNRHHVLETENLRVPCEAAEPDQQRRCRQKAAVRITSTHIPSNPPANR